MTQFNLQDIPFIEEAMSLATTWIRNYLWDYEVERRDLSPEQLREQIELGRNQIGFAEAYESARKWWKAFENENQKNPKLILKLIDTLCRRKASITELFLAYVYSGVDNILANLQFLDFMRFRAAGKSEHNPPSILVYSLAENVPDKNKRVEGLIEKLTKKLSVDSAEKGAVTWWNECSKEWADSNAAFTLLLSNLVIEKITVQELFDAACLGDCDDILALLPFVLALRMRRREYQKKAATMHYEDSKVAAIHSRLSEFQRNRRGVVDERLDLQSRIRLQLLIGALPFHYLRVNLLPLSAGLLKRISCVLAGLVYKP
jgi:hypothetical protein